MRFVGVKPPQLRDPFDHSECGHPEPVFPIDLSPRLRLDLVQILHTIWLDLAHGRIKDALVFVEELARYVEMSALGYEDVIDDEVDRTRATAQDLRTLRDNNEFDEALRRLYEEGKE